MTDRPNIESVVASRLDVAARALLAEGTRSVAERDFIETDPVACLSFVIHEQVAHGALRVQAHAALRQWVLDHYRIEIVADPGAQRELASRADVIDDAASLDNAVTDRRPEA